MKDRQIIFITVLALSLANRGCELFDHGPGDQDINVRGHEAYDPAVSSDVRHYAEENPAPDPSAPRRSPLSDDLQ
jgi:hypothetical protein